MKIVLAVLLACFTVTVAAAADVEVLDTQYAQYIKGLQEKLPKTAAPVIEGAILTRFHLQGEGPAAHFEFADAAGQSFSKCIRVKIPAAVHPIYNIQILSPETTVALKKGDYVFTVMNVRCVQADGDRGILSAFVQMSSTPWTGIAHDGVIAGKEWKRIYFGDVAQQDFPVGGYQLAIHLGAKAQTLELGGVAIFNLGSGIDPASLPYPTQNYIGEEPDAPWRKAAAERIEKIRKGELTVHVVGADDKPLAGAKVRMVLQRHAFGFGTFIECEATMGEGPDAEKLREFTAKNFNRVTTPIYWADWGWANPEALARYMRCAKWAFDHHLTTRGHVIIYPGFHYMPAAMKELEKDPPTLRKKIAEHVVEAVEATKKFAFSEYDVTNELRDETDLHKLLGKDVVTEWFKLAREHAAPTTHLALNENTILTRGGETQTEQDNYFDWIQYLSDHGACPDVIGMQGHFDANMTDPALVYKILDRFAKFGKPIQITEFDLPIRDEACQARYTRDFLTLIFSHPSVEAFTMWGFWEGRMWQSVAALVRKDWTLKPNGQAFMDLTQKEWKTDVTASTAENGACGTRGFLGDYAITVTHHGVEKSATIKLVKEGASVTVKVE